MADETTGVARRVVIDWRAGSSAAADLRPAIVIEDKNGKVVKLARDGEARYLLSVDAILSVDQGAQGEGGRRDRAYPDRKRQDPRHHGRSAARGGAVRGAAAEGCAVLAETDGNIGFGKDYKNKRRVIIEPNNKNEEPKSSI